MTLIIRYSIGFAIFWPLLRTQMGEEFSIWLILAGAAMGAVLGFGLNRFQKKHPETTQNKTQMD